jgi:predicted ATP-binding protein involved in virulence
MQITELQVDGLFGQFDHVVPFTPEGDSKDEPSVTIIHGPNGVGKTTLLRMLRGMMDLQFTEFRRVPFKFASLTFNTGDRLSVCVNTERRKSLKVEFDGHKAELSFETSGAIDEAHEAEKDALRDHFRKKHQPLISN